MNKILIIFAICLCLPSCRQHPQKVIVMSKWNSLTPEEERVIIGKGTEMPYTGKYVNNHESGIYLCRQCDAPLYRSADKFDSGCGWPSFDDEMPGAVKRTTDADGRRTEITCAKCGGHLGHVFLGEGFTKKDTRHCVNSISLDFVQPDTAYFASGCFWGTEYHFEKAAGVISTDVGYMGGHVDHPTYKQVCTGETGHLETTMVVFNPKKTTYEKMVQLFFETHDFSQTDGQGPDLGSQYLSAIFYINEEQRQMAELYKKRLTKMGHFVATSIRKSDTFWMGEDYHQNYYTNKNGAPYCHAYRKIF